LPSRAAAAASRPISRVRPGDPGWPKEADWDRLRNEVGGRLVKVESPLTACIGGTSSPNCDDRAGAPGNNVFWASNLGETGQVLYAYQSAWIPASLLEKDQQKNLADALFAAAQHWHVALHVNKGLAGAPPEAIAAAKNTATNPAVLDAFALLISGASGPPAYPGVTGHEPDASTAREEAEALSKAMNEVRKVLPKTGSYVSESDFFEPSWQESFWGSNYKRLLELKDKYDPDGPFFGHHGVGSERWSADGFTRA